MQRQELKLNMLTQLPPALEEYDADGVLAPQSSVARGFDGDVAPPNLPEDYTWRLCREWKVQRLRLDRANGGRLFQE